MDLYLVECPKRRKNKWRCFETWEEAYECAMKYAKDTTDGSWGISPVWIPISQEYVCLDDFEDEEEVESSSTQD